MKQAVLAAADDQEITEEENNMSEATEKDWADFGVWAERNRQDAARYRYLRDRKAYVAVQPHYQDLPKAQRTGWTIRLVCGNDESMDAAIDAAMGADE
jgi:hypothetical protein